MTHMLAPYSNQLLHATPLDWHVAAGWQPLVNTFFSSSTGIHLLSFLQSEIDSGVCIFPKNPLHALFLTPPEEVQTVILGQDPYHRPNQAEGLAFSVPAGVPPPPSLRNIFKERKRDLDVALPPFPNPGGSLVSWAKCGVLLLNTCLTVQEGKPASHAERGWEELTQNIIAQISQCGRPLVFMLWGSHAQKKEVLIADRQRHLILKANHPSPLSALRPPQPFIGCGHFSAAEKFKQSFRR